MRPEIKAVVFAVVVVGALAVWFVVWSVREGGRIIANHEATDSEAGHG